MSPTHLQTLPLPAPTSCTNPHPRALLTCKPCPYPPPHPAQLEAQAGDGNGPVAVADPGASLAAAAAAGLADLASTFLIVSLDSLRRVEEEAGGPQGAGNAPALQVGRKWEGWVWWGGGDGAM